MSENLRKRRLLVVSDTSMQASGETVAAYEPVIRELTALCDVFDEIIWLGCKDDRKSRNLIQLSNDKIRPIIMPSVHNKYFNVLAVLLAYPIFIFYILRHVANATHIHSRGPSHPALIIAFFSWFDSKRVYWHKYAGEWRNRKAPFTYRLQQYLLQAIAKGNIYVTMNGDADNNPNIISMANPCLTDLELQAAQAMAASKTFSEKLTLLFVGSLTLNKGVKNLMLALAQKELNPTIETVFIAGEGPLLNELNELEKLTDRTVIINGQLSRTELNELYAKSHIVILPSLSEGFPKVIAEASAYGCIPVVTKIPSLRSHIHHQANGFFMDDNTPGHIAHTLNTICNTTPSTLSQISQKATSIATHFTYSHYFDAITPILEKDK